MYTCGHIDGLIFQATIIGANIQIKERLGIDACQSF